MREKSLLLKDQLDIKEAVFDAAFERFIAAPIAEKPALEKAVEIARLDMYRVRKAYVATPPTSPEAVAGLLAHEEPRLGGDIDEATVAPYEDALRLVFEVDRHRIKLQNRLRTLRGMLDPYEDASTLAVLDAALAWVHEYSMGVRA